MNRSIQTLSILLLAVSTGFCQMAVDIESLSDSGFYILMDDGTIDSTGTAVLYGDAEELEAVDMALTPSGNGYYILGQEGLVLSFGNAVDYGSPTLERLESVVDMELPASGLGYYVLGNEGKLYTLGDATFYGESIRENAVDFELTTDGLGYYVLYADGTIAGFGSAVSYGQLNTGSDEAVDLEVVNQGYHVLLESGQVRSFGNAKPIGVSSETSETATALELTSRGYLLLDEEGGVQMRYQSAQPVTGYVARINPAPMQEATPTPSIDDDYFDLSDSGFTQRILGRIPTTSEVPESLDTGQLSLVNGGVFVLTSPEESSLVRDIRFYSLEDSGAPEYEGVLFARLVSDRGEATIRGISYSASQGIVAVVEEFNGTFLIGIAGDFEESGISGFSIF